MSSVDVYFSFRSPYSYLATPGVKEFRNNYNIEVNLRPVMPIAIRAPEMLFKPENAHRTMYILTDWSRRAEFLGMSSTWPSPDPIVQDMQTMKVADEQPYIYRLSSLGVEAQRRGRGVNFAAEVAGQIFGTKDWHLGDHLRDAVKRAGLDLADMDAAIDGGDHLDEVETNQASLEAAGGWGVPSFVFEGELFFGQDRIETLCWRLDQHDLRR
jgi:2-hydroxychromene-2-carboxylate isomerase